MEPIRIIIAENDEKQRKELITQFNDCPLVTIVGETGDGHEAIRMVLSKQPDLFICNMILRSYDAPAVLEQISLQMQKLPKTVVISPVQQESSIVKAFTAGAEEFMLKPLNRGLLFRRISEMMKRPDLLGYCEPPAPATPEPKMQTDEERTRQAISALFLKIGLPAHLLGFRFALEAVFMLVQNPMLMKNRTKVLYPAIAELHQTSVFSVERAIRHAICITWQRGIAAKFMKEHGQSMRLQLPVDRPSSGEFIALIAEYIRPRRRALQLARDNNH